MLYAKQGNRVKKIHEEDINRFVEMGYTIIKENGTVVKDTVPVDIPSLQLGYRQKDAEIATLKAEIEQLQVEIANLKAELNLATSESTAPTLTEEKTEKAEKPKGRGKGKGKETDTEA